MTTQNPVRGSARQRMIISAVALLRERGAGATTIDAVLAHSGAPRGSVYHHFPGGRQELLRAALELAGSSVSGQLERTDAGSDPRDALSTFTGMWREGLVASEYRAGCPVVALVVEEGPDHDELRRLAAEILADWRDRLADVLARSGVDPTVARRRATFVISSIEGAIVLCRAERSVAPLDAVEAELRELLSDRTG